MNLHTRPYTALSALVFLVLVGGIPATTSADTPDTDAPTTTPAISQEAADEQPGTPHPTESANGSWCITGADVRTSTERNGELIVCVEGDRIVSVLDADAPLPPGFDEVRADGMILTAGLIEADSRIGAVEISAVANTVDVSPSSFDRGIAAAFRVADSLNPWSSIIPVTRSGGITSVLTVPTGGMISGQAAFWDLGAPNDAQLIVRDDALMSASWNARDFEESSRAQGLMRLREVLDDARLFRAEADRFLQRQLRDLSAHRLHLEALGAVIDGEQLIAFRSESLADMRAMLRLAEDEGLRIAFFGASDAWAMADELAAAGVMIVVDPTSNLPARFDMLGARADNAALLEAAGVPIVISSGSTHNARNLRYAAGNAVRAGLDPYAALVAITLRPAMLAGVDESYGSIEEGKIANLVVWTGDPFEFSSHAESVIVRGEWMPDAHRQQRLLQRYLEPPSWD